MDMGNLLRILTGSLIIRLVHYPWRVSEKLLRKQFPMKGHYYIMKIFRALGPSFPVTISYLNPLAKDRHTIKLRLDLCENSQLWYFREKGGYELDWIKLIGLAMDDAEMFIDVGANIGIFAITIAQAFPLREVVAIEPLPANYLKLEESVRLNRLPNIRPIRAAVTETEGPVRFYVNPIHDGGGSIIESKEYRTGDVRIDAAKYQESQPQFTPVLEVAGLRLDDIITSKCVLKIDVEGAEVSVLKSAVNSLKSGLVDLLVVEVTKDSIGEVIGLLDKAGFDCFIHGQRSPITEVSQFNRRIWNIFCLRRHSHLYNSIPTRLVARKV